MQVRGPGPVNGLFPNRTNIAIMVFARERGVDITLDVTDSAGHLLGRADNPIGVREFSASDGLARQVKPYSIVGHRKGSRRSNGIRSICERLSCNTSPRRAVSSSAALAGADSAYAAGQAVTARLRSTPGISSDNPIRCARIS